MSGTPSIWRAKTPLNTNTIGLQAEPRVIQMGDGNIVTAWVSDSTSRGLNWVGVIRDPLGDVDPDIATPVNGELILSATSVTEEFAGDIAPLVTGGFTSAYAALSIPGGGYSLSITDVTAGGNTGLGTGLASTSVPGNILDYPTVSVSSANAALVAWLKDAAGASGAAGDVVRFAIYDPVANTLAVPAADLFSHGGSTGGDIEHVTSTVLANGNFVVAAEVTAGAWGEIWYEIVSPAGVQTVRRIIDATDNVIELERAT